MVVERVELSPRMLQLTFEGEGLRSFQVDEPAASIRLLVPRPGAELELPEWSGNEFLDADGSRPLLRTLTPLRLDVSAGRIDVEIVRHPGGAVSEWAEAATAGDPAAISGTGRGFVLPDGTANLIVVGDETALPAIGQILSWFDGDVAMTAHVEIIVAEAEIDLRQASQDARIGWYVSTDDPPGGELVSVVRSLSEQGLAEDTHLWAAGEASAMQAIRSRLFDELGLPRSQATVRGYWKPARD